MATRRIPLFGWETLPDTSGNAYFEPASISQPTNDRYPQMVARYKDTATKDGIGFRRQIPLDYVGNPVFKICWTQASGSAGNNAIWDLDYSSASQTSSIDPSADEANLTVTTVGPAPGTPVVSSMTATAGHFVAGDLLQGRLSRDGASSDTIAADLIVYDFYLEYTDT